MLKNFSHEDWERFLKQSADQLRMQPSHKVWRRISWDLQTRKRRIALASVAVLCTALSLSYYLIDLSDNTHQTGTVRQAVTKPVHTDKTTNLLRGDSRTAIPNPQEGSRKLQRTEDRRNNLITARTEQPVGNGESSSEPSVALLQNIPVLSGRSAIYPGVIGDINHSPILKTTTEAIKLEAEETKAPILTTTKAGKRKWDFQLTFTPTISYRKLSENNSLSKVGTQSFVPFSFTNTTYNINNAVTHKPSIGLELGFAAKYAVARNVKLRGGLQFNMSRYDIKVFNYTYEVATIPLRNGAYFDSLSTITNLRNFNGTEPNWLQNLYFQVSAPVGIEYKIRGNSNMQLGIAGTVQPTYVLGDRAYLLTTDYKNYAQVPWLIRRWNMAANVETFVAYSTGKINWQIGPQARYQLFSSYSKKYPVKENLFDFGLKVGISLNKAR
ncbi:MAG: hypothetical protein ICV81_01645 [Flavisolibacter sp.]|nr:hypothetical protein [Flavisolibacter sp.]